MKNEKQNKYGLFKKCAEPIKLNFVQIYKGSFQ